MCSCRTCLYRKMLRSENPNHKFIFCTNGQIIIESEAMINAKCPSYVNEKYHEKIQSEIRESIKDQLGFERTGLTF